MSEGNKKETVFHFGRKMGDIDTEYLINDCLTKRPEELYRQALQTTEGKQELYQKALNAVLENLMSWERAAIADGFEVIPITDMNYGMPTPIIKDGIIHFVQRYGVQVRLAEERTK